MTHLTPEQVAALKCVRCGTCNPPVGDKRSPLITVEQGYACCSCCANAWRWPPKHRSS